MLDAARNFAKAQLSLGYSSTALTVVLAAGGGAKFPAQPFNAVWWDATLYLDPSDDPNVEVVRVTGISTDTLTVTRAQESTSAANHNIGGHTYMLAAGPTAKLVTDLGSVTDDTSTNATMFPVWATAASGNLAKYVSSTKLAWNPSTGCFGLGTTAPMVTLDIVGPVGLPPTSGVSNTAGLRVRSSTGSVYCLDLGMDNGSGKGWIQSCITTRGDLIFPLLLNPNGGNVGIGTAAPTSPLQVVTLPTYTTNAAAVAGGLTAGAFFKVNVAGEYFVHVVV